LLSPYPVLALAELFAANLICMPQPSSIAVIGQNPRAGLLILHGLAEYAQRYRALADTLAERRISTFAFDHRGHGAAAGLRTHVDRFDDFVDDALVAFNRIRADQPSLPLFVWGHSMGATIALLLASRKPTGLRGLIVTSNSLDRFKTGLNPLNPLVRLCSRLTPRVRMSLGLDARKLSHDPTVQRAYANDPLIPTTASLRLIVELAAANELANAVAPNIQIPTLIVHGDADAIAPSSASTRLHERVGSSDKQLRIYPHLRHELHNEREPERSAFIDLMTSWIDEHIG
jgi:alpha-beta hydrolase superfamily lysophospholipase